MKMKRLTLLLISVGVLSIALTPTKSYSQSKNRFDPDGSFWIIGTLPADFSDFGGINLNSKRARRYPTAGLQLNNGKTFRYKTVSVKKESFTFTTLALGGVSYSFAGHFLRGGVFASDVLDDQAPVLEGTLTKYKAGKKIAEAQLKFSYFGGT
jgi:hypothetical protein